MSLTSAEGSTTVTLPHETRGPITDHPYRFLVVNGLLEDATPDFRRFFATPGHAYYVEWRVTEKGRDCIRRWLDAEELD